jgi:hypothetical protein
MTKPPSRAAGGSSENRTEEDLRSTIAAATDESRRTLKRARRVIGAALAQAEPDLELVCAAELVILAGGRHG